MNMMPIIAKSTLNFCYEQARVGACPSVEMIIPNCVLAAYYGLGHFMLTNMHWIHRPDI